MKVHYCTQGSQTWFDLRRGKPTASEMGRILPPVTRKPGAGAKSYLCELIGDALSAYYPEHAEAFTSRPMLHGRDTEEEARRYLAMELDTELETVGFIETNDGRFGASPDSLVTIKGRRGGVEIKCPANGGVQAERLLRDEFPTDALGQCHGGLVCGEGELEFWLYLSYHPGLPPFLKTILPDDYTQALREELEKFYDQYQTALAKIRAAS